MNSLQCPQIYFLRKSADQHSDYNNLLTLLGCVIAITQLQIENCNQITQNKDKNPKNIKLMEKSTDTPKNIITIFHT